MSDFWEEISIEIERSAPSSLAEALDRYRPYDGQLHTDYGQRGRTLVEGLTMRDVADCFTRACFDASGLSPAQWPDSIYDLPWDEMDIIAVRQNLTCWLERYMNIFPNIPPLLPTDPTELHWCGWPIEMATWTSHEGACVPDQAPYGEES